MLLGLGIELGGAFLLSAEAIGISRIREWRERYLRTPAHVLEPSKSIEMDARARAAGMRWLPGVMVGLSSGLGSAVGAACAIAFREQGAGRWALPIGLVLGGTCGAFAIDIARRALLGFSSFLTWVEERAGKGTIGLVGFCGLAFGIITQALAVLLESRK
jgi:hypothetical protein